MAGKIRPSLRGKTLANVFSSRLSKTDKDCIYQVFKRYEELTTTDVAEVVRCKDCKYRITHTCAITGIKTLFCDYAYGNKPVVEPTHYCGYGETKHT